MRKLKSILTLSCIPKKWNNSNNNCNYCRFEQNLYNIYQYTNSIKHIMGVTIPKIYFILLQSRNISFHRMCQIGYLLFASNVINVLNLTTKTKPSKILFIHKNPWHIWNWENFPCKWNIQYCIIISNREISLAKHAFIYL